MFTHKTLHLLILTSVCKFHNLNLHRDCILGLFFMRSFYKGSIESVPNSFFFLTRLFSDATKICRANFFPPNCSLFHFIHSRCASNFPRIAISVSIDQTRRRRRLDDDDDDDDNDDGDSNNYINTDKQ